MLKNQFENLFHGDASLMELAPKTSICHIFQSYTQPQFKEQF
jgi:hypothetical protein